jgi:hypothetical protein
MSPPPGDSNGERSRPTVKQDATAPASSPSHGQANHTVTPMDGRGQNPASNPRHHVTVALESAAVGWEMFPCRPDKTPATPHGFKDATTSPHRIESWWDGHPEYLVATPTEGSLVVDLDEPDSGPTGDTWAWWCRFAEPHGWDPTVAPLVATPSGGVHIYWRQPDGVQVRNSASKLAPGVDIRADGGYVIVPGSVLPDGREYELLCPHPAKVIDAPGWLVEACNRTDTPKSLTPLATSAANGSRYGLQALEGELGRLALTPEGQRNHALNTAAFRCGQLAGGGELDPVHAAAQLHAVALQIGLSESETAATIRSGMTNGARNPRRPAA